jgi:hypothetical protein
MTKTRFEQIPGELEGEGRRYTVKLDITVKELFSNESEQPVDRAIARMALSPRGERVQDGSYTLRYVFNGKQAQDSVRTQHGMLLAGH